MNKRTVANTCMVFVIVTALYNTVLEFYRHNTFVTAVCKTGNRLGIHYLDTHCREHEQAGNYLNPNVVIYTAVSSNSHIVFGGYVRACVLLPQTCLSTDAKTTCRSHRGLMTTLVLFVLWRIPVIPVTPPPSYHKTHS